MAVTREFYLNIYGGTEYDDLDRLLKRAAGFIDSKIIKPPEGEYQEKQYDFAVCAQAEYMGFRGGFEAWFSETESGGVSSVHIGSFSISSGNGIKGSAEAFSGMPSTAVSYLEKGGLLYRGCAVWR